MIVPQLSVVADMTCSYGKLNLKPCYESISFGIMLVPWAATKGEMGRKRILHEQFVAYSQ